MDGICNKHGMQPTIHVSSDIKERMLEGYRLKPIVVLFEFEDEIIERFYLSSEYAAKYKLVDQQIIPLPDDYPRWVLDLSPVCSVCLMAAIG